MNTLRPYAPPGRLIPAHWTRASMPDADLHLLRGTQLHPLDHAKPVKLAAALAEQARATTDERVLLASGEDDSTWRLRRIVDSKELWRIQPLNESRSRIFTRMRCLLSSRLSSQFLHDLRNPGNALSLHADLLARLVTMPDAGDRSVASLRVIRERLTELTRRQSALVALWLAAPGTDSDTSTQGIMENAVRVVRGFGALHEIHLRADGLDALNACAPLRAPVHTELAFIGLLMLAYECALNAGKRIPRELALRFAVPPDHRVSLKIPVPVDDAASAAGFEWDGRTATVGEVAHDLKLLLDNESLELRIGTQNIELLFEIAC